MISEKTDWLEINRKSWKKSLIPVALPQRDHIPFWNQYAVQFIYPPAFEVTPVHGISKYHFELKNDKENILASFDSADPQAPLTSVWAKVPVGFVNLSIYPINRTGKYGKKIFTRRFYRCAAFHGPYEFQNHDYKEGAQHCFSYVYNLPHIQAWLNGGTVDDKVYRKYCYPSKLLPSIIRALRHYAEFNPTLKVKECVTKITTKMADWLIENSFPPGTPLEYLPPTYWKDTTYPVAQRYVGQIMMNYPMNAGNAYLDAYELSMEQKYLEAACRLADSMKRLQLPNGSWFLKIYEKNGTPVVPNLVVFDQDMHNFLIRLVGVSENSEYQEMCDRAMERVWKYNLLQWDWDGQFEDIAPKPKYENLTKDGALFAAHELFKKGNKKTALQIIDWCEDQFVVWSQPAPTHGYVATWRLPAALEQYHCYMPIDASTSQFIFAFSKAYREIGDNLYLEKAKALGDNILRNQKPDGSIPTFFQDSDHMTWLNCMIFTAEKLLYLDETLTLKNKSVTQEKIK